MFWLPENAITKNQTVSVGINYYGLYFTNAVFVLFSFFTTARTSEKESQAIEKLKDLVDKQRDEMRAKEHELTLRNEDVEAVRV